MQKKGDLLNQLAIISDLIEKMNTETKSQTIIIELSDDEFTRVYQIIEKKYGKSSIVPEDTFNIKIGTVDIIFNKSNV